MTYSISTDFDGGTMPVTPIRKWKSIRDGDLWTSDRGVSYVVANLTRFEGSGVYLGATCTMEPLPGFPGERSFSSNITPSSPLHFWRSDG